MNHHRKRHRLAMLGMQRLRVPHRTGGENGVPNSAGPADPVTIANDQTHNGDITCEGTVKIDGSIVGDVRANRVVVGTDASATGALIARTVHIDGHVTGSIDCSRLSLGPTARIVGDVEYDTLSVSKGASVSGHCQDRKQRATETKIAYLTKPTQIAEIALPFNVAKAAFRRTPCSLRPATRPTGRMPNQTGSMRAIWDSYQRNRVRP